MQRWTGKIAVVTGASAGIGVETVKALVRNGMTVLGLSHRVDKMKVGIRTVKETGKLYAKACDVSIENDVIQTFQWIEQNFKTVHVLVNNAGILKSATIQVTLDTEYLNFKGTSMNIYPATKFTVTAICKLFINELNGGKIRVTSTSPGIVKIVIFETSKCDSNFFKAKPAINPEDVANFIIHVISAPPHV